MVRYSPKQNRGETRKALSICCVVLMLPALVLMTPQAAQTQRGHATVQILGALQPPGLYPPLLTIHPLDYVTFINQAVPATTYTIAAIDGSFVSPLLAPGQQWTVTFSDLGAHEYHDTSNPQLVIGEILVVANSVSLLPTPVPQVEATVLAYIRAGRTPPDDVALFTPPSVPKRSSAHSEAPSILLILGSILILLGLVVGGFFFIRHFHRPPQESIGETIAVLASAPAGLFKNLLQRLKRRKDDDDDDDDDDNVDDEDMDWGNDDETLP